MVVCITLVWEGSAFGWQVIDPGFGSEFFEDCIACVIPDQLAEADGFPCRAVGHGILILVAEPVDTVRTCGYTGWKLSVAQPVSAEKAFGNGPFFLRDIGFNIIGHSFVFLGIAGFCPVENTCRVRTCSNAEPATDAPFVVDQYNAVVALEGGINRTNLRAGGIVAVHAGFGHIIRCGVVGILHLQDVHMVLFGPELVVILAGFHAFAGISAPGKVNDHYPLASWQSFPAPLLVNIKGG